MITPGGCQTAYASMGWGYPGRVTKMVLLDSDELLNREDGLVAWLRKSANLNCQVSLDWAALPGPTSLLDEQMRELLNGHYITHKKNLRITCPMGCGNNRIVNALAAQACRQKLCVQSWLTGQLLEFLAQGHVD
ncbi:TPA: ATP-binding protein [Salmonella enterica subsp. diarizonae serovar 61:l,v:z35]